MTRTSGQKTSGFCLSVRGKDTCINKSHVYVSSGHPPLLRAYTIGYQPSNQNQNPLSDNLERNHPRTPNFKLPSTFFVYFLLLVLLALLALVFLLILKRMKADVNRACHIGKERENNFMLMYNTLLNEQQDIAIHLYLKFGKILPLIKANIVCITKYQEQIAKEERLAVRSLELIKDASYKISSISFRLISKIYL